MSFPMRLLTSIAGHETIRPTTRKETMSTTTRPNPFAVIGKEVEATSAVDAARQAGLDWHVQLADLQALAVNNDGVNTIPVPSRFATVRTNHDGSQSVLGTVGGRYKVLQNGEMFSALDSLVDSGDARYAYAGEQKDGAQVYMVMELPKDVTIKGDPHKGYLIARTSHDGSCSLGISPMVNRLYCMNQIKGIFRGNANYSLKHTQNAVIKREDIATALQVVYAGINSYVELATHLLDVKLENSEVKNFLRKLYPLPSEVENTPYNMLSTGQKRTYNTANFARDTAFNIYAGATGTQDNIKGTAFGAFQAVVEFADHFSHKSATTRADRVVSGSVDNIKSKAVALLTKGI